MSTHCHSTRPHAAGASASRPVPLLLGQDPAEQTYTLPLLKLLTLRRQEALDNQQMVGHLLQHIIEHEQRLQRMEQTPPGRQSADILELFGAEIFCWIPMT